MAYKVNQLAQLAGISVRTLHHYDEIGLLEPSERSEAGYRLYSIAELERLQQILYYRELGFPLTAIRRVMSHPRFDRLEALAEQRRLLIEKRRRIDAMITGLDRALANAEKGINMDEKDMFEVFGDFDPTQYEEEVKERWGETDAYKESARRTAAYGKEDWARIKTEQDEINSDLVDLAAGGAAPDDERVQEVVERHWRSLNDNFYSCAPEMYRGLGEMYVADPRFKATYDAMHPGLAEFFRDAIRVWAAGR